MLNQNSLERVFRQGVEGKRTFVNAEKVSGGFSQMCRNIINGESDFSDVSIHIGFGLPMDYQIPYRLPVLLIPALEIITKLLEVGIKPPQCIIYQATDFIIESNGLDKTNSYATAHKMKEILINFCDRNFSWGKRSYTL